jgi:hypothetical protein
MLGNFHCKKNLFFLIISSFTLFRCEGLFEKFERIPDEIISIENKGLELFIDDFNADDSTGIDESENQYPIFFEDFSVNSGDDNGTYLESIESGFLRISDLDLSDFDEITINFWIKTYTGNFESLLYQGLRDNFAENRSHHIIIADDLMEIGIPDLQSPDYSSELLTTNLLDGEWNMMSIVLDSINNNSGNSVVRVYVNGNSITNYHSNIDFRSSFDPILFEELNGGVDNIRIYSRIFNQMEISHLFGLESPQFQRRRFPFEMPDGLFTYLNFESGTQLDIKENHFIDLLNTSIIEDDTPNGSGKSVMISSENSKIVASVSQLFNINSFSFSFWAKFNQLPQNDISLIRTGNRDDGSDGITISNNKICFGDRDFKFSKEITKYLSESSWNMFTITCEKINDPAIPNPSSQVKLYINGEIFDQIEMSELQFLIPIPTIGNSETGGQQLNGLMDNIRLYNRALSEFDVLNIYFFELN